jgi:hypothetical protein
VTEPYRVLVTGSRDWGNLGVIRAALAEAELRAAGRPVVLVHGQCDPRHVPSGRRIRWKAAETWPSRNQLALAGADWLSSRVAAERGWLDEPHPADWHSYGKAAGFVRNGEMAQAGADECDAFINWCTLPACRRAELAHGSHGASDCARLAREAGIPVRRFEGERLRALGHRAL